MEDNIADFTVLFKEIIKTIRTGDYGNASSKLNEIMQLLQDHLNRNKIDPQKIQKLIISLQTLFSMQKMGDWVAVADILEYEFADLWIKTITI